MKGKGPEIMKRNGTALGYKELTVWITGSGVTVMN